MDMKHFLLVLAVLLSCLVLNGNPISVMYVSRLWFDINGDFWIHIGPDYDIPFDVHTTQVHTGSGVYDFPATYEQPAQQYFSINLSEVIPGFTIDPVSDFFFLDTEPWGQLTWGNLDDYSVNVHPLTSGQSAVHVRVPWITPEGPQHIETWVKDSEVNTAELFNTDARCTINLHLRYENGDPVINYPVYFYPDPPNYVYQSAVSDANGDISHSSYAMRQRVTVLGSSGTPLLEQLIFCEPGETYNFADFFPNTSAEDEFVPPALARMIVFPNVLNRLSGNTIHLQLDEEPKLKQASVIELYDLKGRQLANREIKAGEELSWQLPELGSGIYFLRLKTADRELGTAKLTIIR